MVVRYTHQQAYTTLGLKDGCTQKEVKAVWLGLIKKIHPDRYPEHQRAFYQEKTQLVNEAYQFLKTVRTTRATTNSYRSKQNYSDSSKRKSTTQQNSQHQQKAKTRTNNKTRKNQGQTNSGSRRNSENSSSKTYNSSSYEWHYEDGNTKDTSNNKKQHGTNKKQSGKPKRMYWNISSWILTLEEQEFYSKFSSYGINRQYRNIDKEKRFINFCIRYEVALLFSSFAKHTRPESRKHHLMYWEKTFCSLARCSKVDSLRFMLTGYQNLRQHLLQVALVEAVKENAKRSIEFLIGSGAKVEFTADYYGRLLYHSKKSRSRRALNSTIAHQPFYVESINNRFKYAWIYALLGTYCPTLFIDCVFDTGLHFSLLFIILFAIQCCFNVLYKSYRIRKGPSYFECVRNNQVYYRVIPVSKLVFICFTVTPWLYQLVTDIF